MTATVPSGTPAGAGTLVITATDVISPARTAATWDLLWVGDWVAPPSAPWHRRRLYLPVLLKGVRREGWTANGNGATDRRQAWNRKDDADSCWPWGSVC